MRLGYRDVVNFLQRDAGKLLNPTDRTVRKALVPLDPTQTFLVDAADDLGAIQQNGTRIVVDLADS
jgi:hypothetical protein